MQTLEERAEELAKHCNNPVEALEHLRAVERAAYERAAEACLYSTRPNSNIHNGEFNAGCRMCADRIRALSMGGFIKH